MGTTFAVKWWILILFVIHHFVTRFLIKPLLKFGLSTQKIVLWSIDTFHGSWWRNIGVSWRFYGKSVKTWGILVSLNHHHLIIVNRVSKLFQRKIYADPLFFFSWAVTTCIKYCYIYILSCSKMTLINSTPRWLKEFMWFALTCH